MMFLLWNDNNQRRDLYSDNQTLTSNSGTTVSELLQMICMHALIFRLFTIPATLCCMSSSQTTDTLLMWFLHGPRVSVSSHNVLGEFPIDAHQSLMTNLKVQYYLFCIFFTIQINGALQFRFEAREQRKSVVGRSQPLAEKRNVIDF